MLFPRMCAVRLSSPSLALRLAGALLLVLTAVGCGADPVEPSWISLARGWSPERLEGELSLLPGLAQRPDPEGAGLWIDRGLVHEAFLPKENTTHNAWSAPMPDFAGSRNLFGLRVEVRGDGTPVEKLDLAHPSGAILAPHYTLTSKELILWLPADAQPFARTEVSIFLGRGAPQGETWRAPVEGTIGDGLCVWPGERTAIRCDLPPASALRFRLAGTRWDEALDPVTYRVRLDGELLFEERRVLDRDRAATTHTLPLPPEGRAGALLEFSVEGRGATTAFLVPVVGPRELDAPPARPDLVLFIADTFRADNLALHGGAPDLTPALDALAARSLRFLEARSPATSTLPAHASLFTGLFPTQHGAINERSVPASLPMLAEVLASVGYRTAAITDSGFASRQFGLDRGFQVFDERPYSKRKLVDLIEVARAERAADDGRPLFLFVQTYRVHAPYRAGLEESQVDLRRFNAKVREWVRANNRPGQTEEVIEAAHARFREDYLALYHAGVRAFDEALAPWLTELDADGFYERGALVFTSDHGEEFFEHGDRGHGGPAYEERIRIPLLLRGEGIEPGDVLWPCSLTDVGPTLARLAGAAAPAGWIGRSLLTLDSDRPQLHYNENRDGRYLAAFDRGRKLFFEEGDLASGALSAAYDLERDPGETRDALAEGAIWPEELRTELLPLWKLLGRPAGDAVDTEVDPALQELLRELGYAE